MAEADAAPTGRKEVGVSLKNWWNRLVLRMTARRWNCLVSRVLCRAYEHGLLNSEQLHLLAKEFDPTQRGTVGRLQTMSATRALDAAFSPFVADNRARAEGRGASRG